MSSNPRFSVQPMGGKQLPERWMAEAPQRAKEAENAYLNAIQNAWKGSEGNGSGSGNIMRDARLKPPTWEDMFGKK